MHLLDTPSDAPLSVPAETPLWQKLADIAQATAVARPKGGTGHYDLYYEKDIRAEYVPFFLMRVAGHTLAEIANTTGYATNTVGAVLRSRAGQQMLAALYAEAGMYAADVGQAFRDSAPLAVETVINLMQDGESEQVRLKAAFSVLDRAGYGAVQKTSSTKNVNINATGTISMGTVNMLMDALRESQTGSLGDGVFEIAAPVVIPEDQL